MNQRLRDCTATSRCTPPPTASTRPSIELLLLVMVADRHITDDEIDEIRSISEDSGWESSTFSFDQYLGQAMAKVRSRRRRSGRTRRTARRHRRAHRQLRACASRCSRRRAMSPVSIATSCPRRSHCSASSPPGSPKSARCQHRPRPTRSWPLEISGHGDVVEAGGAKAAQSRPHPGVHRSRAPAIRRAAATPVTSATSRRTSSSPSAPGEQRRRRFPFAHDRLELRDRRRPTYGGFDTTNDS